MNRTVPLRRSSPLRRVSTCRRQQLRHYETRRVEFLREHPYCQFWLAEHGIAEELAIRRHGILRLRPGVPPLHVPRSSTVHHRNKRRGARLLDEREWMAVSWTSHRAIEAGKRWARERGYLRAF